MSEVNLNKNSYAGLTYRELQKDNSIMRQQLKSADRLWLKSNNFRNVGWTNVVALFEKLKQLIIVDKLAKNSIEELFSEIDRIGSKYQESAEVHAFETAMAQEAESISAIIDRQFPDLEPVAIDFGSSEYHKSRQSSHKSKVSYRTVRI